MFELAMQHWCMFYKGRLCCWRDPIKSLVVITEMFELMDTNDL